jgi:phenylpropionate dioxygenase-like ring-hydroxylating dioxygenase large terminal subunit
MADTTLKPPQTKGRSSVVKLEHQWFIACTSEDLGRVPLKRTVQGVPLVLFRNDRGEPGALLDRCPHRNVPLSAGKVALGQLQCGYHGWTFDVAGQCTGVPGLCGEQQAVARNATAYASREQDGYVWVYSTAGVPPQRDPYRFPAMDDPTYTTVRQDLPMPGTMHAAIENALDVPHTGFLHGGLFRTAEKKNRIRVVIRRGVDRVEAEYLDEPRPSGLVGRVLAPGGGTVTHFDRFVMPCLAQVEYRLEKSHFLITTAFTPVTDFEVHAFACVSFRLPIPGALVSPLLMPVAMRIFRQDAEMLKLQTESITRFGGEQFVHTEIDVLGPHIWHLLRQAERGLTGDAGAEPIERQMVT